MSKALYTAVEGDTMEFLFKFSIDAPNGGYVHITKDDIRAMERAVFGVFTQAAARTCAKVTFWSSDGGVAKARIE